MHRVLFDRALLNRSQPTMKMSALMFTQADKIFSEHILSFPLTFVLAAFLALSLFVFAFSFAFFSFAFSFSSGRFPSPGVVGLLLRIDIVKGHAFSARIVWFRTL